MIRIVTQCKEVRQLSIPLFCYTPRVLTHLSKLIQELSYLQTLTLVSPESCTLFHGIRVPNPNEEEEDTQNEDVPSEEFLPLITAIQNSKVLIRLTFDMGTNTYSER